MSVKNKRLRIQVGLARKKKLLKLAREFRRTEDPQEIGCLGEKLGEMMFGKDPSRNAPASEGGRYIKKKGGVKPSLQSSPKT